MADEPKSIWDTIKGNLNNWKELQKSQEPPKITPDTQPLRVMPRKPAEKPVQKKVPRKR